MPRQGTTQDKGIHQETTIFQGQWLCFSQGYEPEQGRSRGHGGVAGVSNTGRERDRTQELQGSGSRAKGVRARGNGAGFICHPPQGSHSAFPQPLTVSGVSVLPSSQAKAAQAMLARGKCTRSLTPVARSSLLWIQLCAPPLCLFHPVTPNCTHVGPREQFLSLRSLSALQTLITFLPQSPQHIATQSIFYETRENHSRPCIAAATLQSSMPVSFCS